MKRQLLFPPCMYFFLLARSCTFMQYTCTVHCCHYILLNYTSGYSCRLMDLGHIHASCVLLTPARCTTICTIAIYIRVRKCNRSLFETRVKKWAQQNKLYRRMFCTLLTFRQCIVQWPENWEKRDPGEITRIERNSLFCY